MNSVSDHEIANYEDNIGIFHQKRIERLNNLQLNKLLKRKNPYLFKSKDITIASVTRTESGKPAVDVKRLKKKRYPHRLDHCIDGRRHRWLPHERTLMDPANHRNSCTNTQ